MEKWDTGTVLEQAMSLDGRGDRRQALELCRRVLAQIDKDDPRRHEIATAIAYLEEYSVIAVEPAKMTNRRNLTGLSQTWGPARWGVLVVTVLFGFGMLLLSAQADFQGNPNAAGVLRMYTPFPGLDMPQIQVPQLGLAPTPLALAPTAIITATLKPTPTATLVPSPTSTSSPTLIPPTIAAPSKPSGGGQGGTLAGPSTPPTPVPSPPPAPTLAPQPGTAPQPGPGGDGGGGDKGGGNGGGDGKGGDKGGGPGKGGDKGAGKGKNK